MKKISLILVFGILLTFHPLFSTSPTVKGYKGLFEIAYPFTLSQGTAGFVLGVNNIDLKTNDVDINRFFLGIGWGVLENLEFNLNLSYNRVHVLGDKDAAGHYLETNVEYPFSQRWQTGLGYASVGLKYNLTKSEKTGFGILAHVDIPLSDSETAVSTGETQFGVDLLFAHAITDVTIFSINAGYQINTEPDEIDGANFVRYAAGIEAGIGKNLSFATQLAGKMYSGTDLEQDNPLDLIVGFKFNNEDRFGISIGYKKNILFNNKSLGDSHGGIGSIWVNTAKKEVICNGLEAVSIKGDNQAKATESRSYQAITSPDTANTPITYKWSVSGNGAIASGQGSPTISVKWNKESKGSWVKVVAENACPSSVDATLKVNVIEPVMKPKDEFFFAFDSYELCDAVKADLDTAAAYFKYHPEITIEIQGHTCSIATEEYNLALGQHRAEAAKNYLVEKGVSSDKIKIISYGEEKPSYDNSEEVTRKKNRRVYIPYK